MCFRRNLWSRILQESYEQSNEKVCEVRVGKQKYQIVRSDETKNGMQLVSYYPTRQMMRQVRNIMTISGIMLGAILIFGMIYISLFVKIF